MKIYFLLACGITWFLLLPVILSHQGIIALNVTDDWHFLGALGPILAAFYVARRRGVFHLWLVGLLRTHVETGWLLISVISPFILFFIAYIIALFIDSSTEPIESLINSETINLHWVVMTLIAAIAYGIGEEAGWRGFALPWLQKKENALKATMLLAMMHAVWHIPFFFYRFEFTVGMAIGFFIGLVAGTVWLTFLYNSTGGSAFVAIIWHTGWNIVNQVAILLSDVMLAVMSTSVIILAVYIVSKWGSESLSPKPRYTFHTTHQDNNYDKIFNL